MGRRSQIIVLVLGLGLSACTGDKPKELLETAELEERQHNEVHAKQLYEDLVRLYPTSPQAEIARARLTSLSQGQ
jgi:TolA-binding protein